MTKKFKHVFVNNNKLKEILLLKGVILKDVAESLNISYRGLSYKFNGKTEFKLSEILSICKTYDINIDDLIEFVIEVNDTKGGVL